MPVSKKKSGGAKKVGRCAKKCAAYRASGKHERARQRKLKRHIKRQPTDKAARESLRRYGGTP